MGRIAVERRGNPEAAVSGTEEGLYTYPQFSGYLTVWAWVSSSYSSVTVSLRTEACLKHLSTPTHTWLTTYLLYSEFKKFLAIDLLKST